MTHFTELPSDLPPPVDDGACDHLRGLAMPPVRLPSTAGRLVDLGALGPGRTVIYCYPRTGRPDEPLPTGWDAIPGARGCTPSPAAFATTTASSLPSGPRSTASARRPPSTSARWRSGCTCRSRC